MWKKDLNRWKMMLESSLSAATFAEANAPEIAREFLHSSNPRELVLYAGRAGHLSPQGTRKAIELCQRLKCGLAVLITSRFPAETEAQATDVLAAAEGEELAMPCRIHLSHAPLPEAVKQFMAEHRRVISLVLEEQRPSWPKVRRLAGNGRKWWQDLSCPVVFV